MSEIKDWVGAAAHEIASRCRRANLNADVIALIIVKHCPFKPDTAYEEVKPAPPQLPVEYGPERYQEWPPRPSEDVFGFCVHGKFPIAQGCPYCNPLKR